MAGGGRREERLSCTFLIWSWHSWFMGWLFVAYLSECTLDAEEPICAAQPVQIAHVLWGNYGIRKLHSSPLHRTPCAWLDRVLTQLPEDKRKNELPSWSPGNPMLRLVWFHSHWPSKFLQNNKKFHCLEILHDHALYSKAWIPSVIDLILTIFLNKESYKICACQIN